MKKDPSIRLKGALWAAAALVSGIALLMHTSLRIDVRMTDADNVEVRASYDEEHFFQALESRGGHRVLHLPLYNIPRFQKPLRLYFEPNGSENYGIAEIVVGGHRIPAARLMEEFLPLRMLYPKPDGAMQPAKPREPMIVARYTEIAPSLPRIIGRILIIRNLLIAVFAFCCAGAIFTFGPQLRRAWRRRHRFFRDYYCIQTLLLGSTGGALMVCQLVSLAKRIGTFPPLSALLALGAGLTLEVAALLLVSRLLGLRHWWTRIPIYLLTGLAILFYAAEIGSIAVGDETLTLAALENIIVIDDLMIPWWCYAGVIAALLVLFGVPVLAGERDRYGRQRRRFAPVLTGLVLLTALLSWRWYDLPEYDYRYTTLPLAELTGRMRAAWFAPAARHGGSGQEFFRDTVAPPLPFPVKAKIEKPNLIVIFIEGFSARLIGCYGGKRPDLTPEIDRFARRPDVMQVQRYYNHTAYTYRGIYGQCTSVLMPSGAESKFDDKRTLPSLASILNERGYETAFFYSQRFELDAMLKKLGFTNLYNFLRIHKEKLVDFPLNDTLKYISDDDLFAALTAWLERRPKDAPPFFVGLYNFETHAFMASPRRSTRFNPAQPNPTLDQTHHVDKVFGRFVKWFMASPYAQNTVLIFTSDHAHYHGDTPFAQLMKAEPDYQSLPYDRIPLLIYDPGHKLPNTLDVNYATSLDFAPTVLQILGVTQAHNAFLGESFFDRRRDYGFASGGDLFFLIRNGRLKPVQDAARLDPDAAALLKHYQDFGRFVQLNPPSK